MNAAPIYDLLSTNNHISFGITAEERAESGHYVAPVKYGDTWVLKNDAYAPVRINESDLQTNEVYLLYYQLRE
jgi:ubiquitin C-terminal hydrolase